MIPAFVPSLRSVAKKFESCLWLSKLQTKATICLLKLMFTNKPTSHCKKTKELQSAALSVDSEPKWTDL